MLLVPYQRRRRVEQMLASANIEAVWSGPPSAEEIRAGDQARLLDDPMLNEPPAEEDLALARLVLANRTPEQVATALIRFHRSRLPEPEELYDAPRDAPAPYNPRDRSRSNADRPDRGSDRGPDRERGPNPHEGIIGETVWFRLAVGRSENADPKWLIPLICRNGHVTKKDIGQIRIFDRETKVEIAVGAADRFTAAIANGPADRVKIEPAGAPGKPHGKPAGAHVKPRDGKPYGGKPHAGKSNDAQPREGGPREGGPPPKYAGKPKRPKPPFKRD